MSTKLGGQIFLASALSFIVLTANAVPLQLPTDVAIPAGSKKVDFYGAIAYSQSTKKIGTSKGQAKTRAEAENEAVKNCGAPDAKAYLYARGKWMAIAVGEGSSAAGFETGATSDEAQQKAIDQCRKRTLKPISVRACFHTSGNTVTTALRSVPAADGKSQPQFARKKSEVEARKPVVSASIWQLQYAEPTSTQTDEYFVVVGDLTAGRTEGEKSELLRAVGPQFRAHSDQLRALAASDKAERWLWGQRAGKLEVFASQRAVENDRPRISGEVKDDAIDCRVFSYGPDGTVTATMPARLVRVNDTEN